MQYSSNSRGTRDPNFFEDPSFQEATRLIELDLHLIPAYKIPRAASFLLPDRIVKNRFAYENLYESYPPLCFTGTSRGQHGNESKVNGTVTMGLDGIIRWRFVSTSFYLVL